MMRTLLTKLFADGNEKLYDKGSIILHADNTPEGVYLIVSGWVKVYKTDRRGEEKILMTLEPGDIFPFAWAITGTSQDVNFAALDTTRTLCITMTRFKDAVISHPNYAQEVLHLFAQQFSVLVDEVTNLQYHSAHEKVVLRLLALAESFGSEEDDQVIIKKRVSNDYIARSTSMSRETTSREMSRLVRERLIRHTNTEITIPNITRLRQQVTEQRCPPKNTLHLAPVSHNSLAKEQAM